MLGASPASAEEGVPTGPGATIACVAREVATSPPELGGLGLTPVVPEIPVPPDAPAPETQVTPPPPPANAAVVVVTVTNPDDEPLEVTVSRDDGALATSVVEPATPEAPTTVTAYEVVAGGTSTVTVSVPGPVSDGADGDEDGASTALSVATSTHDCSPAATVCDGVVTLFEPPAAEGTLPCPEPETDPGTVPSDPVDPGTGETDVPPVAVAPPADAPGTDAALAATGESDFGADVLALAQVTQPDLPPPPPPSSGSIVGPATDPDPAPDAPSEQAPAAPAPDDPALATTGSDVTPLLRLASALLLLGFALLGASRWTNRARRPARRTPSRKATTAATLFAAVLPRPELVVLSVLDAAPIHRRLLPPPGPPGRLARPATG